MKKIKYLLTSTFTLSLLGCVPELVPVAISNIQSNQMVLEQIELLKHLNPEIKNVHNIDLKGGDSNTGSFALNIQANAGQQLEFKTQNSIDGSPNKTKTDIQALQVMLINSATSPPGGLITPTFGPFNVNTSFPGAGNQTIVAFTNVTSGNYYACVAAFDNGVTDHTSNITSTQSIHYYSQGHCYMTNGGGEGGSPGRVTIDGAGAITGTAPLTVNINLTDERGAKIQTDITVIDGS